MVNEGAKILEEGIAQRASDIDVVWLNGYGWPRPTGGPMFWAEQVGLDKVVDALNRYRDRLGAGFSLSPLPARCAARGGSLFGTRSEEHTSELQSLMRSSYAVFCLKKKNKHNNTT